jgi:hypothetical protein
MKLNKNALLWTALVSAAMMISAGCGDGTGGNPNPPSPSRRLSDIQNDPRIPSQAKQAAASIMNEAREKAKPTK